MCEKSSPQCKVSDFSRQEQFDMAERVAGRCWRIHRPSSTVDHVSDPALGLITFARFEHPRQTWRLSSCGHPHGQNTGFMLFAQWTAASTTSSTTTPCTNTTLYEHHVASTVDTPVAISSRPPTLPSTGNSTRVPLLTRVAVLITSIALRLHRQLAQCRDVTKSTNRRKHFHFWLATGRIRTRVTGIQPSPVSETQPP